MSLMKWFRKNNKKVMAVVVIVIMIGFIGGTYFSRLSQRRTGLEKTAATFGNDNRITNYDLALARQELETLKSLRADTLLRTNVQDLHAFFLGELLFSEQSVSPILMSRIKQTIQRTGLNITEKQINDIYKGSVSRGVYWLLLSTETEQAGIEIPRQAAGSQLAGLVPQLFMGATYPQLITSIVNRQGIPEDQILKTFGKLLSVLTYARMACSTESFTGAQLSHIVRRENETLNSELVEIPADFFVAEQNEPSEQEVIEHFENYKDFFAGQISSKNPYGFGYKLPAMVQLEYLVGKLDDISQIVAQPTPEEMEDYYQRHRAEYTKFVPSDPNDPNSTPIEQTQSYAEVAAGISEQLLQSRINSKAEEIIQEARTITQADLESSDTQLQDLTAEQIKNRSGDYKQAAEQLSEKYQIKIYTGRTGLLSAVDMTRDRYLGMMSLGGLAYSPVGLTRVVFAIDKIGAGELGPFEPAVPEMYENIGPVRDYAGQIIAVLRITQAREAAEPNSIDLTVDKSELSIEQEEEEKFFSVREKVIEDVKKLAAMDIARQKAEEFKENLLTAGWDKTIDEFNTLYKEENNLPPTDPNVFRLQPMNNLRRISNEMIQILEAQSASSPFAESFAADNKKRKLFIDKIYNLVPPEEETLKSVPFIMEFKPDLSLCIIRNLAINRFNLEDYRKIKAQQSYRYNFTQSQNLSAVHFNPDNILKRMNFAVVSEPKQLTDANVPAEQAGG
ncbi:hypothetical protein ACFL1G_04525 [Planctomycetota bacterium]